MCLQGFRDHKHGARIVNSAVFLFFTCKIYVLFPRHYRYVVPSGEGCNLKISMGM